MIRLQRKDEMRMEVENDLAKALETISDENMEKLDVSTLRFGRCRADIHWMSCTL